MSRTFPAAAVTVLLVGGLVVAAPLTGFASAEDAATLLATLLAISVGVLSRTIWQTESALGRIRTVERQLPAPDVGVLICDAADEKTLVSVARQVQAEVLPARSERKRTSGRTGSFSILFNGLGLGRSSTRSAEETDVFEDTDDTNVLLGRVLRALNDTKALRRDLVRVPGLALEADDRFDDSQAIARVFEEFLRSENEQGNILRGDLRTRIMVFSPTLDENSSEKPLSHTVVLDVSRFGEELSGRLGREVPLQRLADSLRHRWSQVANGTLVLVEGPWDIVQTKGGLVLKLAALTVDEGEDSPERTIEMPIGLAVECRVANAMLLDHRSGRLDPGHRMTLGIFGQVSRRIADDGRTLTLEPTAVFERLAAPN